MRYLSVLLTIFVCIPVCAAENPYRVGVVIPLSGDAAGLGNYVQKGIELGLQSLPKEMQEKVQVIFEDDQLQAAKSVAAFRKLKSYNKIDAVFVISSGIGHAVAPLAEESGTVMLALGASDKTVAVGKKFVFTHWVSPEAEAAALVDEIIRRNFQKLAVVSSEQQGAAALEDALLARLKEKNLNERIVYSAKFSPDTKDFRVSLAKIRSAQSDGIVSILLPGSLSAFAKQTRDFKISAELFGFELFEDEHEVKASDGALIGKWYVNAEEPTKEFRDKYVERYKEQPGMGAANSYDAIQLIARAVSEFHGESAKIADYLRTLKDYEGASGRYSATGDNRFNIPAALKVVTKNGFEKLR